MKKWEKEILQNQIKDEANVTVRIETVYKKALEEINDKIQVLMSKDQTQSVIYQVKYQQQLYDQVESIYSKMSKTWYQTIDEYLNECYENAFYSTMYALHNEGIPLIIPFNQEEVAQAAAQDFSVLGNKLSDKLYSDTYQTAKKTVGRITKGIAMNSSYSTIALEIAKTGTATVNNALRITRTEGHRIHEEVKFKTINRAAEKGADIVKQWDASIDRRTRKSHAALDGQLRELDQPFKSPTSGHTAMYPGGFGIASEDINCRCVVLQRARWALDKSELDKYVGDLDGMTDDELQELADKFGVSKDELIKKSNGVIEADGSINHRIKAKNYNQFKKKYQKKEKLTAEQIKAQEDAQKIAQLQNEISDAQNKLNAVSNKTYSGIWKDDIKVSDYGWKKGSIQSKKDYYLQKIASGGLTDAEKAKYLKYLDDLDEFEKLGSEYEKIQLEIKKIQDDINKLTPKTANSVLDAFTQERKNNALWFDKKHGGFHEADKYFDPPAKAIHASATRGERDGFYTYTQGSGGHNRPLVGFRKPWSQSGTGWEEKFYVGSKKVWIDFEGKGDQIRNLTTLIEKSVYDKDVWLQSGQGFGTIEGFLNIPKGTLQNMTDADFQQFIGQENIFEQFLSTAVNEGGGGIFNSKPLKMNIYAPKGSQMLYASDVGAYGKGENEMILQRGGTYKITKMYWGNDATDGNRRKIFIDVELHPEKGYDLFQQDPNEWTGSRANYRNS